MLFQLLPWQQVIVEGAAARLQGGRGGEGVWLWLSLPTCRNYRSLALGFARAVLVSLIYHLKITAAGTALINRPPIY